MRRRGSRAALEARHPRTPPSGARRHRPRAQHPTPTPAKNSEVCQPIDRQAGARMRARTKLTAPPAFSATDRHLWRYLDSQDGRGRTPCRMPSWSGSADSVKPAAVRHRRLARFSGSTPAMSCSMSPSSGRSHTPFRIDRPTPWHLRSGATTTVHPPRRSSYRSTSMKPTGSCCPNTIQASRPTTIRPRYSVPGISSTSRSSRRIHSRPPRNRMVSMSSNHGSTTGKRSGVRRVNRRPRIAHPACTSRWSSAEPQRSGLAARDVGTSSNVDMLRMREVDDVCHGLDRRGRKRDCLGREG